jgi:hypothetical protein
MNGSRSIAALSCGIALVVLGLGVVLDDAGSINLEFAYTGPSLLAALGAILLASGLASRRRGRG